MRRLRVHVDMHEAQGANDIPLAIKHGRMRAVYGPADVSYEIALNVIDMKHSAMRAYRKGESISVADLAKEFHTTEEGVLANAMYDSRLVDFIKENKSFTLSKVNGFVENPVRDVGPWLKGRLVSDEQGEWWIVPKNRRVVIKTEGEVSRVKEKTRKGEQSDTLGRFIA